MPCHFRNHLRLTDPPGPKAGLRRPAPTGRRFAPPLGTALPFGLQVKGQPPAGQSSAAAMLSGPA